MKKAIQFLGIDFNRKVFIFCDEVQFVKSLSSIAKYFIDHYYVKFFLTGSASFYIKNLFTESLAGRKFIFALYSLSCNEFFTFKKIKSKIPDKTEDITQTIFKTTSLY
ncbi:MAG: AAA family ATPase [Spirochaetota bacterium]|uniref:AAA family ATPase n=1 Tax=Candidatus Jordarchaeum sp. TaxID=2823881 RepID=UPI00404A9E43